ncbi:hypothetical protein Mgra_00003787 [Meloidogyne graminicola]|uniref:Uncharacterized protein n=1 Tax=Meloidogyne graminicola TaxID=189291 RepID=A0A8S9ZUP3_9BILA|nr:hypothetical protein Mgra_00003787 [Meloidogyne graminicola]
MKEENHPNEIFYQEGSKIGLNEVNFKEEIGQIILKDHKLISNGANEMRKQLIELSFNGQSIKDLLISKSNKELFSNTSGFVLSNVRYVRAYYCVQKMAKLLENVYQSNYSKYAKVLYAINGVWIGNKQIVNEMENVVRLTNNLAEINIKNSKLPNLTKERKEISEAIKNVAISENALTINERKGSTMALVGYFAVNKNPMNSEFNKCNKHKYNCIVYFHIKSNHDLSFEEFFDIDMI